MSDANKIVAAILAAGRLRADGMATPRDQWIKEYEAMLQALQDTNERPEELRDPPLR